MKITTVVTVYNLERFVAEAIDSVLAQSRPADEILVVDDASTDGSADIIAGYGDRVRYVRQPQNVGALKNTLTGLQLASGELVAFLDGDDVWAPTKLERVATLFDADPNMVLASHGHERVDENLRPLGVVDDTHRNIARIMALPKPQQVKALRHSVLNREGFWLGSAYMVRKSLANIAEYARIIEQHAEARHSYLDLTLGPFMLASAPQATVGFVDEVLFQYRVHTNNSCSTITLEAALKGCLRARSINRLTYKLMAAYDTDGALKKRYDDIDGEYELLERQYNGNKLGAIVQYARSLKHLLHEGRGLKEMKRLAATTLLGPERFLELKHRP